MHPRKRRDRALLDGASRSSPQSAPISGLSVGPRPTSFLAAVGAGAEALPTATKHDQTYIERGVRGQEDIAITVGDTDIGFKILPGARYVHFGDSVVDHFKHMLLPSLSLALGISAVFMRLLRSDMIGTLRQPFIDLARSKGVSPRRILWRHALRPSTFTLLTVMGFTVGSLIGGALIVEIIFTIPGIGSYMFGGITQRDFVAVQGGTMVIATLYILVLIMVDFLYLALDPRLRTGGSGLGGTG